jgi:HSP20 family protein
MSDDVFAEFDAMFADFARRARPGGFEPNADLYLSPDGTTLVVAVEIAGADPSELRVMVEERRLYILGRRIEREREARAAMLRKEIVYGEFVKKLLLPIAVAYDEATAAYRDGILTIKLPVSESARPPERRIEIRMNVRRTLA